MCTVSWLHEPGGYQLLCNRDEKLTRAAALPPRIRERDGVRYVAPVDRDFGGAWIGSNEFGVSICLLNGTGGPRAYRSRGLLIPDLLSVASSMEVSRRVSQLDLSPLAAFTLAILAPGQCTTVIEWNGQEKAIVPYGEPYMPLGSSSVDPDGVQRKRREEFARRLDAAGKLDSVVLLAFHASHGRGPDAYSPCMHRPDAKTVSFSWICVGGAAVEFFYAPEAPCQSWRTYSCTMPRTVGRTPWSAADALVGLFSARAGVQAYGEVATARDEAGRGPAADQKGVRPTVSFSGHHENQV